MATKLTNPTKEAILSRREIEHFIASGNLIFILDDKVIKADAWLKYHPGGQKPIQHMVGRDATDEVTAFVFSDQPFLEENADGLSTDFILQRRRNRW